MTTELHEFAYVDDWSRADAGSTSGDPLGTSAQFAPSHTHCERSVPPPPMPPNRNVRPRPMSYAIVAASRAPGSHELQTSTQLLPSHCHMSERSGLPP